MSSTTWRAILYAILMDVARASIWPSLKCVPTSQSGKPAMARVSGMRLMNSRTFCCCRSGDSVLMVLSSLLRRRGLFDRAAQEQLFESVRLIDLDQVGP